MLAPGTIADYFDSSEWFWSLRLVPLLAFDAVVREGEGFLVVPAATHHSEALAERKKGCL